MNPALPRPLEDTCTAGVWAVVDGVGVGFLVFPRNAIPGNTGMKYSIPGFPGNSREWALLFEKLRAIECCVLNMTHLDIIDRHSAKVIVRERGGGILGQGPRSEEWTSC